MSVKLECILLITYLYTEQKVTLKKNNIVRKKRKTQEYGPSICSVVMYVKQGNSFGDRQRYNVEYNTIETIYLYIWNVTTQE